MPARSASAMLCRYSPVASSSASFSLERQETSARMAGISVVTSTRNGADLMPRSRSAGVSCLSAR